jgi:hypothetical protein
MTEKQWEQFFGLLDRIVNGGQPWEAKKAEVERKCDEFGTPSSLEEFLGWWDGQMED